MSNNTTQDQFNFLKSFKDIVEANKTLGLYLMNSNCPEEEHIGQEIFKYTIKRLRVWQQMLDYKYEDLEITNNSEKSFEGWSEYEEDTELNDLGESFAGWTKYEDLEDVTEDTKSPMRDREEIESLMEELEEFIEDIKSNQVKIVQVTKSM
jgi:flagellar motility protein MotE (MotC chaperone)